MFGFLGNAVQLMGAGFSAGQASALVGPAPTTGVSGAGTTLATATALAAVTNLVSTVASGTGVKLPTGATVNDWCFVYNDGGANTLAVYPDAATSKINGGAVGIAVNLAPNTAMLFIKVSSTRWVAMLSA